MHISAHIFYIQSCFILKSKIFFCPFLINTWFWSFRFFPSSGLFCRLIWSTLFTKIKIKKGFLKVMITTIYYDSEGQELPVAD